MNEKTRISILYGGACVTYSGKVPFSINSTQVHYVVFLTSEWVMSLFLLISLKRVCQRGRATVVKRRGDVKMKRLCIKSCSSDSLLGKTFYPFQGH